MVSALGILFDALCKGMRSKTSIYPVFEVILWKTLEQLHSDTIIMNILQRELNN